MTFRGFSGLAITQEDLEELSATETALLEGVPREKRAAVLKCMDVHLLRYSAGASLTSGVRSPAGTVYLAKGRVRVDRIDVNGERSILFDSCSDIPLAAKDSSNIFGSGDVRITALEDCLVVDFNISKEVEGCPCCVSYVSRVRKNIARQHDVVNNMLMSRIDILTRRSIRSKIVAYLIAQLEVSGNKCVDVRMTRQELADYLCVERSALSREIGKMRSEGIIECEKGRFTILEDLTAFA